MREFFLTTARLRFSVWNPDDLDNAIELWGNKNVTRFITANGSMSEEQIKERLEKEIDNQNTYGIQYWPIYLLENCENIGCCGLRPYKDEENILEMGVHLKDKYWGMGYAKEACTAVIEYAFNNLGASAIFAGHNPQNAASAKMLKELGFKFTRDEFYPPTGLMHPSYLLTK